MFRSTLNQKTKLKFEELLSYQNTHGMTDINLLIISSLWFSHAMS